jgi:hypothetical protein
LQKTDHKLTQDVWNMTLIGSPEVADITVRMHDMHRDVKDVVVHKSTLDAELHRGDPQVGLAIADTQDRYYQMRADLHRLRGEFVQAVRRDLDGN